LRRELAQLTGSASDHNGKANGGNNPPKAQPKKILPKYRGPEGQTWAGRGMKPRWLSIALQEGKNIEDFLIVSQNGASP
jgi:DNA-binding protein H-NS